TANITFSVIYVNSCFLPPIQKDGSGVYKQGSTLPTKFQLTDAAGAVISGATAHLYYSSVSNSVVGGDLIPLSTSASDSGNMFRFSSNQYIFNLNLSTFTTGTWQLKAVISDGTACTVLISVR